jgi:hypothetical protein
MKSSIAAVVAALALSSAFGGSPAAQAQDFPIFERDGFPVTPLQFQVLGSDHVEEEAPITTPTRDGMPASPHQLSVLRQTNGTAGTHDTQGPAER